MQSRPLHCHSARAGLCARLPHGRRLQVCREPGRDFCDQCAAGNRQHGAGASEHACDEQRPPRYGYVTTWLAFGRDADISCSRTMGYYESGEREVWIQDQRCAHRIRRLRSLRFHRRFRRSRTVPCALNGLRYLATLHSFHIAFRTDHRLFTTLFLRVLRGHCTHNQLLSCYKHIKIHLVII